MKRRIFSIITALVLCLSLLPTAAWAEENLAGNSEAQWQTAENGTWESGSFADAISGVYDGGTVKLQKDVSLTQTAVLTKSMTITSANPDDPNTITSSVSNHGYLLNITGSSESDSCQAATVTLQNVIVDGGSENGTTASRALVSIGNNENLTFKSGNLVLAAGAVLQNNNNITANGAGGGICVIVGSVEMQTGSKITGNQAEQGGGVALVNILTTFTMSGGTISGNTAANTKGYGGGVYLGSGTFTMTGGTITNNTANYGGGIYGNACKLLEMSGGSVTGNTATKWAGGILLTPDCTAALSGSIQIKDNSNQTTEPGKDLYLDGYTYNGTVHLPTTTLSKPDSNMEVRLYSWLKPADDDVLTLVTAAENYTITAADYAKFSYEDEEYALKLQDNTIVLTKAPTAPSTPTHTQLSDNSSNGTAIAVTIQCVTEGSTHTKPQYLLKANSCTLGNVTWSAEKEKWYCDVAVSAAPYITDYAKTNGSHELASGESDSKTVRFWYTEGAKNPWKTEDGYSGTQRKLTFQVVDIISRTITVTGTADSPTQVTLNTAVIEPGNTGGAVTYAKSTTNTVPVDGWQESSVFTGLTENTTYYFFAKVEASENYAAAVSAGTPITTPAKAVSGIEVTTQPDKLTYTTGETLDLTGLTVKAKYNDGTEETISDLTNLSADPASGASLTVAENNGKPVTITYGGKTCTTNNLTVNQGTQTALTIAGVPEKIEPGDSFTLTAEGGAGTGEITWSVVSGPAKIDQNGTVTVTGTGEITVKAVKAGNAEYEQTECAVTFTSVKKPSSSGPSSSVTTYSVTVEDTTHGTAKADRTRAASGTTVTITVTPDDGCTLDGLTVTDKNGREIAVKDKGSGKYTFTMPASKVTVSVTFTEIGTSYSNCLRDETCPIWPFTDASTTVWYHDSVHYCIENGLMSGYGNSLFGPNDNLSRAQLAQILYNKEGQPAVTGGSGFTDVADGAWYADAVTWAAANGIVAGYGNGPFGPNDPITREQLVVMLWRYAEFKGCDTTQEGMIIREFSDYGSISGYAMDAMTWAVNTGVISGYEDKTLHPQANATRAQVAQMLKNFLEKH